MRELLDALGNVYRLAWTLVYHLAGPAVLWAGVFLIGGFYALTTGQPSAALPYLVLWGLIVGGCRLLLAAVLPVPPSRRAAPLPSEKPLPPPMQAVIVAPSCAPEACPDEAGMVARLPEDVRRLIR